MKPISDSISVLNSKGQTVAMTNRITARHYHCWRRYN